MPVVNIGILAHVDAGKTSLTERILFDTGVIARIGSVDDGTTQTDTMTMERQRGITIRSAVVSFTLDNLKVNLIDTPGHPDFIAEVDRALGVLDAVILVVSAVEGVQPQTRRMFRAIQGRSLPCLFFINKIDRVGARPGEIVVELGRELGARPVALTVAANTGTREATSHPRDFGQESERDAAVDILGEDDPALLDRWVEREGDLDEGDLRESLRRQFGRGTVQPVLMGSAISGAGCDHLLATITEFGTAIASDSHEGALAAEVFKVHRAPNGERSVICRIRQGAVCVRETVEIFRPHGDATIEPARITSLVAYRDGHETREAHAGAGDIVRLGGLHDARIGDWIGNALFDRVPAFEPPIFEYRVIPSNPERRFDLNRALATLADEDPLISVRLDEVDEATYVHLYGEVQREVIEGLLLERFGLEVGFGRPTVLCVERLLGPGAAAEISGETNPPYYATVGFRIRPNAGAQPTWTYTPGKAKKNFFDAAEIGGRQTLSQGPHGWPVVDVDVEVTHLIYLVASVTADYRRLAILVMADAIRDAGTVVCEPVHRFALTTPSDSAGACIHLLLTHRATIESSFVVDDATTIEGTIPAGEVDRVAMNLPGLTQGRGYLETRFHDYIPVEGEPPCRKRTDSNPYNRAEYFLHESGRL